MQRSSWVFFTIISSYYIIVPSFMIWLAVGREMPAYTVTSSLVIITAIISVIPAFIGYILGRTKPLSGEEKIKLLEQMQHEA